MKLFDQVGPINTDEAIEIARDNSNKFEYIVIASISGESALKLAKSVPNSRILCVTCPQGMFFELDKMNEGPFNDIPGLRKYRDQWKNEGLRQVPMNISQNVKTELLQKNVQIVQGTIPFFGPSFSMRLHLNHVNSIDILAKTLELISTGTLVCLETVLMATDSGLLPESIDVLSLAGTEKGLDTVCSIRSCSSSNLFHQEKGARFIEFFAKPKYAYQPNIDIRYLRS